jgi:DNA-binding response OmpR family regulator
MVTGMRQQTGFFFVKSDPRDPKSLPVDMFMEKPVSPPELLFNIGNLLRRRNSLKHTPLKENEAKQLEPKAILIVEPNNDTAREYEGMFREEGYDVEIVASVGEAVKLIKDIKFNCIIVDVDLPDMAGYDAVSVIKTIEPEINVIITAATNTKELEARVRKEDIFYYYIKSFDREELKLAVRNVFRDSRRRGKAR